MCLLNPQMCRQMPYVQKSFFFLLVQESAIFQNKPYCTIGQNGATLDCLVISSYSQLNGIVNLIQILQGGLEIVLLSWRTFPLTDLHSAEHLCVRLFCQTVQDHNHCLAAKGTPFLITLTLQSVANTYYNLEQPNICLGYLVNTNRGTEKSGL